MCVVCVPQTPAMILIYKSSLKPFPHSGSKTRGGWWYICRWMITSLHQCGQSLAFAAFCNFLKSYFRFYERCDVDVIEKICWHSNLYLQFKKSPSPHPIAYIVSLKYIPSSIKLLHSLGSTFEHDNCFFFFLLSRETVEPPCITLLIWQVASSGTFGIMYSSAVIAGSDL